MTTSGTVLGVIIGRAGSKGLAGKNSLTLAGRPMICHTIEDAVQAESIDQLIVSTDGAEIADAARSMEVEVVRRPIELSDDAATVDAAVRHAFEAIESRAEIIVIFYANVPVRPDGLIDRAVLMLRETGASSVQSYADVGKYHPYWMVKLDESGRVSPYEENSVYRRQDLPPLFIPDGGVIAVTRESLFSVVPGEPHAFLGRDRRGIENPVGAVVDIDCSIDMALAEAKLSQPTPPTVTP